MANTNNHTHNQFMDGMKMFMDPNMVQNMMQNMSNMMQGANMKSHKMPDMSAVQRRTSKAMTEASKSVSDAMQEMMRLSTSATKNMASEIFNIASHACNPLVEGASCKHKAAVQNIINTTASTIKDASKILVETGMDLYDNVTKTMSENIA